MKRRILNFLFVCMLLVGVLPLAASAETYSKTISGDLYGTRDQHYYTLTLEEKAYVTINIDGHHIRFQLSKNGTQIDVGTESEGFRNPLEAGTYTIKVYESGASSVESVFTYFLHITVETHSHNYNTRQKVVAPTCSQRGYTVYACSCGKTENRDYTDKLPHTVVDGPTIAPTCGKDGKQGGKKCSKCGTYTVAADVIPATGLHTEMVVEGKAPTCTENGLKDGIKCSVCGKVLLERETIPAGHTYEKGANYDTCTRCGQYKGELDSGLKWTLDADGHLAITGTGNMNSWYSQPWEELSGKVTKVTLPDGLESIGYGAFRGMKMSEIKIPDTVTSISSYAFADCTALKEITLPESITTIGHRAFAGCTSLEEITLPGNVTTVGTDVFAGSGLRKAVLSEGIKSITESMFADATKLQEVILPESLESVKDGAFSGCAALTEFTFPENITYIAQRVFQGCASLSKVAIPQKVRTIEDQAFQGCTSLGEIDLSGTYVQFIDEAAFKGCTGLKKVILSPDITYIKQEAFAGCTGLTQIVLKRRIPELKEDAFQGVVAAVHCPSTLQGQWENKWSNYDHGGIFTAAVEHTYAAVVTPPTCTEKGYTTYTCTECGVSYKDDYVDVVHNVENGICTVCEKYGICGDNLIWTRGSYELRISGTGDMYDYEQTGEESYEKTSTTPWHSIYGGSFVGVVVIEDGVTSIGDNAFYNLENLGEVQIADSVAKIGTSAFEACPLLEEVLIPDSVTEVGARTFYGCYDLKEVKLSENMTTIPDYMFYFCDLEEITLPAGVTKIGSNAFSHCKLKEVILPDTVTEIGERAFASCKMATIEFPAAVTTIGAYAFNSCENLVAVTIPDTVTQIGEWAFSNCTSLVTFTLPASVTEISSGLLKLCTGLETVYFEGDHYPWYWQYRDCFQNVTASGYYTVETDFVVSDTTSGTGRVTWERYTPCAEHEYGAWEVKRTSTCSTAGVEVSTCTVCRHQKAQVIDKPEHTWTEWTITEEPTEWWEGSKTRSCSVCGETETEVLPKHVHEYTEEAVTPPTCTEKGYTTYTCACGYTKTDNKVVALGHKWDDGTVEKEATEEAEGELKYTCDVCKATKTEVIPKLEHKHSHTKTEEVPATCTEKGYSVYKCGCGDEYRDDEAELEPHQWNGGEVTKEATEEAEGELMRTCEVCGATETEAIPKLKHEHSHIKTEEVPATCTEKGYTVYKCDCGDEYRDDETELADHRWNDGEVTKEATEDAEGEMTFTCTVCKASKTEVIPKLEHVHSFGDWVVRREATCEQDGEQYRQCSCGEIETEVISATGHSFRNGKCENCGVEDPNHTKPVEGVTRLAGNSRYETAFAIADEMKRILGVNKFDAVILASSENFADALAGSYLAAVKEAPILIAKQKYASMVCGYLNENLAEGGTVYILGGTAAMPSSILADLTVEYKPVRLAGDDRYATNLAILDKAGIGSKDLLVATGRDFADSLSASATGLPILLVDGKSGKHLSQEQKDFLATVKGDIYIIGGNSAVPAELREEIEAASGKATQRIAGGSRYETSVKIAEKFFTGADSAVVAFAGDYPDGLCGGPLACAVKAPLILTKDGKSEAPAYTTGHDITSGYVLGGDGLISDGFAKSIFGAEEIMK